MDHMPEQAGRELLAELDNEWHTLRHGNPIPSLYPQTGTEVVKVRGASRQDGTQTITTYEVIVTEQGVVVGRYRVVAEELLPDPTAEHTESADG